MKPKLKSEFVEVKYWECWNSTHRHRSEKIATECIKKNEKIRKQKSIQWTDEKYAAILSQYRNGFSISYIAKNKGLSSARISQVIGRAERIEENKINKISETFASIAKLIECAIVLKKISKSEIVRFIDDL